MILAANTCVIVAQDREEGVCGKGSVSTESATCCDSSFSRGARAIGVDTLAERSDVMFVKTNPVGWGMLISNFGLEYQFNGKFSAELWFYYSALNYFKRTTKFRTFALMSSVKWWFAGSKVRWWADLHLGLGFFNYAKGGDWRYQDRHGSNPALGGGVGLGVRIPLGKNHRWWLEPSVGAGVYHLNYDTFENKPGGKLVNNCTRTFFGLDRVSIAISYRFDARRSKK